MNWEALGNLLLPTFAAMAMTFWLTKKIRDFATRHHIVDDPKQDPRKRHKVPMPLFGGVGIIAAVMLVLSGVSQYVPSLLGGSTNELLGWICAASLVILLGGTLDDYFTLPPRAQILFPLLASLMMVTGGGLGIHAISNPFGGTFTIEASSIVAFVWLMVMTYTTKLLDGLDGLATGIGAIGALMIGLLALTTTFFQPDVALMACVFFGALLGFLAWNFNPAQIFLGEAGSEFIGFFLGVLSLIGGSKIATALLVVGIPMLDIVQVMYRRWREKRSIFSGDRGHLHFMLAEKFGVRKTVWLLYALSISFGLITLSLQSQVKIAGLIALVMTTGLLMYVGRKVAKPTR